MEKEPIYVTYNEAQRLIPFFRVAIKHGPYREAREAANRILMEIQFIREDVNYALGGAQVFLSDKDKEFFNDALTSLEDK